MKILVTGGCGYIGSHIDVELLNNDFEVVIVDDLINSKEVVVDRIYQICNKRPKFYKVDMCDKDSLEKVFQENHFDAVIHLAGLKAVGESVKLPLLYYENNLIATLNLLDCMVKFNVKNIVFSSSATVYGQPKSVPVCEDAERGCTNAYGWTKYFIEQILRDFYTANPQFNVALLRYFNPIGAHESGLIGENPNDIPNNLTPYILKVAVKKLPLVHVFGNDYDTFDGTGVRDYVHVVDLARGHVLALKKLFTDCGIVTYNLGTGVGYSVLDVIKAFSKAVGYDIPYVIDARREGDISVTYANNEKAKKELGFTCQYDLNKMAEDAWNFQKNNPNGYE